MHFDVHYESNETRMAINDMIRYVGKRKAKLLIRAIREEEIPYPAFALLSMLCGVQGFPVKALWDHVKGE